MSEEETMFQVCIYDLKEMLGDDVNVEGIEDMNHAYAMVMSSEGEATTVFLTCDEGIESMADTLEKVATEIRTLKQSSQRLH
jgi:hypothetical protein